MKNSDRNAASVIGLDIGTSRIVLARKANDEFQYEAQLNAFVNIPYSKFTEGALKRESIPYTVQGEDIIVHGNESEQFADLLQVEVRRPMTQGLLNPEEANGLERIAQIVGVLAGGIGGQAERVNFSVPAPPFEKEENLTYHEASLRRVLEDLGFEAKSINEGLAVIYSELEDSNYTGIGISCGGGLCNVCLAYLSVPVVSFSIPKAGDFIDQSAATVTGELATRVRIAKEQSFYFNGQVSDKMHQALSVYYDDMIKTLVETLKEAFTKSRKLPRLGRPIPLVLSGGSAMPGGFRDRFEKILKESDFPIPLSEIRLAQSPLYATGRGALIAGLVEV